MNILVKFNRENNKDRLTRYFYDIKTVKINQHTNELELMDEYCTIKIRLDKVFDLSIEKGEEYNDWKPNLADHTNHSYHSHKLWYNEHNKKEVIRNENPTTKISNAKTSIYWLRKIERCATLRTY